MERNDTAPRAAAPPTPSSSTPPRRPRSRHASHRSGGETVRYEGAGVAAGLIALLIAAALVVIVVAQNVDRVRFELLWWDAEVPLAVLLLVTGLVVFAADEVIGLVWRGRRRRVRELTDARRTAESSR